MKPLLKLLFFIVVSASFSFFSARAAENTIERVDISQKRVVLYCAAEPKGYISQLSDDKRKILLSFSNYAAGENIRLTQGNKTIEDVYVKQKGKDIQVFIQLNEKKGFTATPSFYSRAIVVDIFAWDSLSAAEDSYRGALLGCEHGISTSAEINLKKAADAGSADAMVYSGILSLKKGNLDYAAQLLNRAIELKTTLPDAFAALAQIARIQNKPDKAKRFQDEFAQKTGVRSIIDIPVEYQPPTDSTSAEPLSLAQQLGQTISDDSAEKISSINDTVKTTSKAVKDTTRFASIFQPASSASITSSTVQASMLDGWMKTSVMAAIGFAVTASFYLAWLYFRWRKNKLASLIAATPAQKLDESFGKALNGQFSDEPAWVAEAVAAPRQVAALYKQGSIINMEINAEYERQQEQELLIAEKPEEVIEPLAWENELSEQRIEWNEPPRGEMNVEILEPVAPLLGGYFPPGEVELALHLQQEQQRHKSTALHSIGTNDIPYLAHELSKIAKKFGVEKNSLEVKRTLASLEQDSGAMKDLLAKFSGIMNKQVSALEM